MKEKLVAYQGAEKKNLVWKVRGMEYGFHTKISAPKKHKCQECSASQHPEKKLTVTTTTAAGVVNSEIVKSSFTTWHTYRCAPELVTAI